MAPSPWSLQAQERFPVEKDGWSARVESYQRRRERAAATRHEYRCIIKASGTTTWKAFYLSDDTLANAADTLRTKVEAHLQSLTGLGPAASKSSTLAPPSHCLTDTTVKGNGNGSTHMRQATHRWGRKTTDMRQTIHRYEADYPQI